MKKILLYIMLFGILTNFSTTKSGHNPEITDRYEAYYDFERLGFNKTLKLNSNGNFTLFKSKNSSTPSFMEYGNWKLINDTIFLYKKKIKIDKHNRSKRKKILCELDSKQESCQIDTLIVTENGLYETNDKILFRKLSE